MKKLLCLIWLLFPLWANAQIKVTAIVQDVNGSLYASGSGSVSLVVPPNAHSQPLYNGSVFQTQFTFNIDSFGNLNGPSGVNLYNNAIITPHGTQWKFSICMARNPPFYGLPCFNTSLTITGASPQNITTQIKAAAAILSGGTPGGGVVWPTGAGIPNYTGSLSWAPSYAISGTGDVCLTTNCVMTTPNLGTPLAINLTNAVFPATIGVNITGNAATATSATTAVSATNATTATTATTLASTPSQCSSNVPATGIAASGDANCTVTPAIGAATGTSLIASSVVTSPQFCIGGSCITAWPSGGSGGSVTNFSSGTLSPLFTSSVLNPTTTPALSFSLTNAAANTMFGGPPSGGPGAPSYQTAPTISAANMTSFPTLNQSTTGNALTATALAALPSQCTGTAFAQGIAANGNANCATPSGSGGGLTDPGSNGIVLRTALNTTAIAVAGDFPTLNQSTTGNSATATALASTPSQCSADVPATGIAASGNANCTTTPSVTSLTAGTVVTSPQFCIGGSCITTWPSGGGGGISTFSAGTLSPLFTTSVTNPTSTPALSFSLTNAAANSVFAGPPSGGPGAPSYQTAPTISAANMTSFPTFNQNTTGNAATATALASSPSQCAANVPATGIAVSGNANCTTAPSVTSLTAGTVVTSPQFCIGGSCITTWPSGGGGVTTLSSGNLSPLFTVSVTNPTTTPALAFALTNAAATSWFGNATGSPAAPSYNTAALPAALIPVPTASTLGGTESLAVVAHKWINTISTSGVPAATQPASTDLSDYGSIPNAALLNSSVAVNSQTCALGSTCTIPFQHNTTSNTSQAGLNLLTSTANTIGLIVTPTNSATNQIKMEITGSFTGNAGTATALASTPGQCSANVPATGITVTGAANCTATPVLGNATATTMVVSGIMDGRISVTLVTASTVSMGGVYSAGYYYNQNATPSTAVTATLPTAAAGKQYCIANSDASGVANTGVLRVNTSASGQYIHYNGARGASGGFVISAGNAGDKACFVGWSTTDWEFYGQFGTWTLD